MRRSPLAVNPTGGAEARRVFTQPALHDNLMGRIVDPVTPREYAQGMEAREGQSGGARK